MSLGWDVLKNNYWSFVLLGALIFILMSTVIVASKFVPFGDPLLLAIVGPFLLYGMWWWGVLAIRCESPSIGTIFTPFDKFWLIIRIGFLVMLTQWTVTLFVAFLFALVGGISTEAFFAQATEYLSRQNEILSLGELKFSTTFSLALSAGLFVGVVVIIPIMFAGIVAMDTQEPASGVIACIRRSWKLTSGGRFSLIILWIVLYFITTLSMCALCVGTFFFGLPFFFACISAAYVLFQKQ